jgi:hypothetical protein
MVSLLAAASMPQTRDDQKLFALTAYVNAAKSSLKRFLSDHRDVLVSNNDETIFLRDQTPALQEKWAKLHFAVTESERELDALRKRMAIPDFVPMPSVATIRDYKIPKSDVVLVRIVK